MGRPSKKRQVEEDPASSDEEVAKPSKKAKTKTTANDNPGKDSDGNSFWSLGTHRRVTIQNYKGKDFVNIREYYESNGELKPGKKGIMLNLEQYNALLTAIPAINAQLESNGHQVPDNANNPPTASSSKSPSKEQKRKKKMNIEATSDEEELESA